jgi:ABC-type dipeptide/oligopeptide/nickel transport system permease component
MAIFRRHLVEVWDLNFALTAAAKGLPGRRKL